MTMKLLCLTLLCLVPLSVSASDSLTAIVKSNAKFSDRFFKAVGHSGQNVICSPLSVQLVLGMVQLGAKNQTRRAITRGLNLPEDRTHVKQGFLELSHTLQSESGVNFDLSIANRIFVKSGLVANLDQNFLRLAESTFKATAVKIDFTDPQTPSAINQWVSENTGGKINNLIRQGLFGQSTQMVLINAVYFKGRWATPFEPKRNFMRDFQTDANTRTPMEFMYNEGSFKYAFFYHLNTDVLVLPYKGDKLSFVVVLPRKSTPLSSVEDQMDDYFNIQYMVSRARHTEVEIILPKFRLEVALNLNAPLKELGLEQIFGPNANFSGIADSNPPLRISTVAQKTFIEISEEGTEAAASTYVDVIELSLKTTPRFVADRPFLFAVLHHTTESDSSVIFTGRFVKPQ